ncbi:MAG: sulfatase family protein [Limisphaerales bacterium]
MKLVTRLIVSLLFVAAILTHAASRPNIVYFMADDLGYGDVKCFGKEKSRAETPNFDRLAAEGMMFTDAHAVASVCVPSRMAIMTGRYAWRFDRPARGGPWGFLGLRFPTDTFTLGDLMKQGGYTTGYIGKWHLGTSMTTTDGGIQTTNNVDYTKPLKVGPVQYGFDYSFILPGSLDMYPYVFARNNQWLGYVNRQRGWSAFNRVGPTEEAFEDYNVLNSFSSEVEHFVARHAQDARDGKPFFLYFALTAPHTPTSPHPKFERKSKLGLYGDFLMEADDCLGRLMKALEQHGLDGNTLVIASSDHGAASYAGNIRKATYAQFKSMQKLGHYSSGIYRGFKFSVYEGGRRVPFVAKWSGVIKPGSTSSRLIGLQDVFRTFASASRQKLKDDQGVDSISLIPMFRNPDGPATRKSMIQSSTRSWAVRKGDWKLCLCPGSGSIARYGNSPSPEVAYKAALEKFKGKPKRADLLKAPFVQLFDLKNDPTESDNLADQRPDLVEELLAIFDQQIAAGRSTSGATQKNDKGLNYLAGVPKWVTGR